MFFCMSTTKRRWSVFRALKDDGDQHKAGQPHRFFCWLVCGSRRCARQEEYGVNLLYSVVGERMVLVKGQAQSIPRILTPAPWKSLNGRNPDQIGRMVALILRMFVPKRTL